MLRAIFPLFIIGALVIAGFLIVGAFSGIFDQQRSSVRSAQKNSKKEDKEKTEQKIRYSAQFDAVTETYDNTHSGNLEKVYKDAYMKARAEIVENFAKQDVRTSIKFQEKQHAGSTIDTANIPMKGKSLTAPAEVELYQKRFVELMAEKGKFFSPYEEKEYQIIDKDKFFKGFSN